MSTTPRPPLLSVEKLVDEFCEVHPFHAQLYAKQSACWVRDHYEDLITDGKLRVVEEVESYIENGLLFGCPSCDSAWEKQPRWSKNGKIRTVHYCPGCGSKIKR